MHLLDSKTCMASDPCQARYWHMIRLRASQWCYSSKPPRFVDMARVLGLTTAAGQRGYSRLYQLWSAHAAIRSKSCILGPPESVEGQGKNQRKRIGLQSLWAPASWVKLTLAPRPLVHLLAATSSHIFPTSFPQPMCRHSEVSCKRPLLRRSASRPNTLSVFSYAMPLLSKTSESTSELSSGSVSR